MLFRAFDGFQVYFTDRLTLVFRAKPHAAKLVYKNPIAKMSILGRGLCDAGDVAK
jgi:hypothetical protein